MFRNVHGHGIFEIAYLSFSANYVNSDRGNILVHPAKLSVGSKAWICVFSQTGTKAVDVTTSNDFRECPIKFNNILD
jgi:hypothetical protein